MLKVRQPYRVAALLSYNKLQMTKGKIYKVRSKVVLWPGEQGNWHFAAVKRDVAKGLRDRYGKSSRGFGSLPVLVKIGKTEWQTSIFWDSHSSSYLLPLKAAVRKAEDIWADEEVVFEFEVSV